MDSNHRPAAYETAALPLSYAGVKADSSALAAVMLALDADLVM